jgi:hypothetical protein
MENVEGVVAESWSGTSFPVSLSGSPAITPGAVEYGSGQRQVICFGMVRSKILVKL